MLRALPARIPITIWRILVLLVLNSTIFIHYFLWHHMKWRGSGHSDPREFFEFFRDGVARPFAVIFLVITLLTPFFGRFFCGWMCHMGSWQDGGRWLMDRKWRWLKPAHSWATLVLPFLCLTLPMVGAVVYWTQHGFPGGVRVTTSDIPVLDVGADWYTAGLIFLLVAVNQAFFGTRAICRYFCPLALWLKIFDFFSRMRVRRTKDSDCPEGCLQCNTHCRMGVDVNYQVNRFGRVKDLQCIKCGTCTVYCAQSKLELGLRSPTVPITLRSDHPPNPQPWVQKPYEWLIIGGVGVLVVGSFSLFITHWEQAMEQFCPYMCAVFLFALVLRLVFGKRAAFARPRARDHEVVNG